MTTLDHPCKETCSGWKQGFEAGQQELRATSARLEGLLSIAEKHRELLASLHEAETEIDSLTRELTILKDPSDGRCMEIGALRVRDAKAHATVARFRGLLEETEHHFSHGSDDDGANLWSRISDALPGTAKDNAKDALSKGRLKLGGLKGGWNKGMRFKK